MILLHYNSRPTSKLGYLSNMYFWDQLSEMEWLRVRFRIFSDFFIVYNQSIKKITKQWFIAGVAWKRFNFPLRKQCRFLIVIADSCRQLDWFHFSMALNPCQKSSFIFNIQVFVFNVMFMIKTLAFKNRSLSFHSKSYPVVINPNSKMLKKIFKIGVFFSTINYSLQQPSLCFNI